MGLLSYTSFDAGNSWVLAAGATLNRAFDATPSLGAAAVVTHTSLGTSTINVRNALLSNVPVDVVGLLGTNLYRGDQVGVRVYDGVGTVIFSQALTTIADDWPISKPRHFIWRVPRPNANPYSLLRAKIDVRFPAGVRFFGRTWFGPAIGFAPISDLGYSYGDAGAKVERTITGEASFVEMPVRRAVSVSCANVTQALGFDAPSVAYTGATHYASFRELFDNGYLRRSARMLLLPTTASPYMARMAEYCRMTSDVTLKHTQGPKLQLQLAVEED